LPLSLLPVLGKLDQPNRDGKLLQIKVGRRGLIGNRPNIFQDLHGKLRAPKEFDGLYSSDDAIYLNIGGFEQRKVIWLFKLLGPVS